MAYLCDELSEDFWVRGNLKHLIFWKRWRFLLAILLQKLIPMQATGKPGARIRAKIEQLSEDQKLSKLFSDVGLKFAEKGQYFYTLDTEEG